MVYLQSVGGLDMRRIALACLLATISVGSATSENGERWGFVRASASDVRLFYGSPDSDDITFSVICNPSRKRLRIADFALARSAREGQKATVVLTAGTSNAAYDGKIVRDRVHGGIYFEAPAPADTRIFDLMRAGESLTIALGTARESVPLKEVTEPLAKMERACLGNK